jgi:hypothetical protein
MSDLGVVFRRSVAICLTIGGALAAMFSLALLASAVTGSNTPGSVLLVGFGIILLILSLLILVFAIREWTRAKARAGI